MAVAVEIRCTSQSPTCWKSGSERGTNKYVVVQIPDRCLTRRSIAKHIVWVAVAVKVSHYSCTWARRRGRGSRCWRGIRHSDCAYHVAAGSMGSAVIRKRAHRVEGVSEHSSLSENS